MLYNKKYLKYKKKYIDLKKESIIMGGKPLRNFDDYKYHPDIYYVDLSDLIYLPHINDNFCNLISG